MAIPIHIPQHDEQQKAHPCADSNSLDWLKKYWRAPEWYRSKTSPSSSRKAKFINYEAYLTEVLRARYLELESEFRLTISNDDKEDFLPIISNLLCSARNLLEQDDFDSFIAASTLDRVESYLAYMYESEALLAQAQIALSRLAFSDVPIKQTLTEQIQKFAVNPNKPTEPGNGAIGASEPQEIKNLRVILDEALTNLNQLVFNAQINNALQIRRLTVVLRRGSILLLALFLACPLIINRTSAFFDDQIVLGWPLVGNLPSVLQVMLALWLSGFSIVIMGAMGGFFSGLLQAQGSAITLAEYEENRIKLTLKPIVGALAALTLYALLSWNAFQVITIANANAGTYLLLALIAGFSERFFFQLLELQADKEAPPKSPDSAKQISVPSQNRG